MLKFSKPLTVQLPAFRRVCLTLVGCGGTGSQLVSGLAAWALTLREQDLTCEGILTWIWLS